MIFNSRTDTHPYYLPTKRAKALAAPKAATPRVGGPGGTLAEKCAWMKARQQAKRSKPRGTN
jgi:hypothetical protein